MNIIFPNIPIPAIHDIAGCLESIASNEEYRKGKEGVLHETSNFNVLIWNANTTSMIDMFDEIKPDIIFLSQSQLDDSFNIVCNEFKFKYILSIDEYWQQTFTKDGAAEYLNNLPQKPSAIISHTHVNSSMDVSDIYNNKAIELQSMAKVSQIHNAKHNKHMESDILIDTTNVDFDNDNNTKNNILLYLANTYKTKIIGNNKVPLLQYLGKTTMFERADFIRSAKILINLNTDPSSCWDASYLKTPSITLYPVDNDDTILQFNSLKELSSTISTILNKPPVRKKYIEECHNKVFNSRTYFHIASDIFNKIDEHYIGQSLLEFLELARYNKWLGVSFMSTVALNPHINTMNGRATHMSY